jgi:hypothetical protein
MTTSVTTAEVLDFAGGAYQWTVRAGTPNAKDGLTLTREDSTLFIRFGRGGAIVEGFWCKHVVECGPPLVLEAVTLQDKDKLETLLGIIKREGERVCV